MNDYLNFQMEILKQEIDIIEKIIARIETVTQTIKNWALVSWTGSIGFALSNSELNNYIILTGILPFLFWILDASWRRNQKRSVYRSYKIKEFLNDKRLELSFEKNKFIDFELYDPVGNSHMKEIDYKKKVSLFKTVFYQEVIAFYLTLIIISIVLSLLI